MISEIYSNAIYSVFIKKDNKSNGYIGFIDNKVAFLPKNFKLPSYLRKGKYDVLGKYIEDKGNYFIINKIELPSIYDIIGVPKNAIKNTNTTLTLINGIPIKISNNYVEFEINNNKCRISSFKRDGNYRKVDMTLININSHFNILNDTNVFNRKGVLFKEIFDELVKILSCNYNTSTLMYLASEMMWLDTNLYIEIFEEEKNNPHNIEKLKSEEKVNIIDELCSMCGYGSWNIDIRRLNIPLANKELSKLL
ncbi:MULTISPECIES: hypothetical protein [Clostridium]|uniref:Uncharacterized protein n=2 Tax=Clostridium TaxID=1485 RepID=A0AAE6I990_CLOSG|nr:MULTISPECIES: hypothetical protein [Clostridium]QDY34535.1 hypothetical protein CGS26_19715 [Clostridium sporogenes]BAO05153.1 uncharacterized protein CBO05P2_128 [Clostridium botulinum B str. Osaka05]